MKTTKLDPVTLAFPAANLRSKRPVVLFIAAHIPVARRAPGSSARQFQPFCLCGREGLRRRHGTRARGGLLLGLVHLQRGSAHILLGLPAIVALREALPLDPVMRDAIEDALVGDLLHRKGVFVVKTKPLVLHRLFHRLGRCYRRRLNGRQSEAARKPCHRVGVLVGRGALHGRGARCRSCSAVGGSGGNRPSNDTSFATCSCSCTTLF